LETLQSVSITVKKLKPTGSPRHDDALTKPSEYTKTDLADELTNALPCARTQPTRLPSCRKDTKNESRRRAYQGATRRADEYKDIVEKVFLEPRGRRFSLGAAASNSDCFVAGTRFIA
jgi:hypothetical protein